MADLNETRRALWADYNETVDALAQATDDDLPDSLVLFDKHLAALREYAKRWTPPGDPKP